MSDDDDVGEGWGDHEEPMEEPEEESEIIPIEDVENDTTVRVGGPTEPKERKTTRFMTKYERARVLGTRALQIRFVNFLDFLDFVLTTKQV